MSDQTGYRLGVKLAMVCLALLVLSGPGLWFYSSYNEKRFAAAHDSITEGMAKSRVLQIIDDHGLKVLDDSTSSTSAKLWIGNENDLVLDVDYDANGRVTRRSAFDTGWKWF